MAIDTSIMLKRKIIKSGRRHPHFFSPLGSGSETSTQIIPIIGVKSNDNRKAHPKPIFRLLPNIPTNALNSEPVHMPIKMTIISITVLRIFVLLPHIT